MNSEQALKRLQKAELSILLAIFDVCEAGGISWWMDSGTALGAMRHGGFIPWDDDIDVGMLRADYDRFLEVAPRLLPEGFSLHTARDTKGFAPLFAKVFLDGTRFETRETREAGLRQGIFVDVFPYDFLYEDSSRRKAQISSAVNAQRKSYIYHAKSINVPACSGRAKALVAERCTPSSAWRSRILPSFRTSLMRTSPSRGGGECLTLS